MNLFGGTLDQISDYLNGTADRLNKHGAGLRGTKCAVKPINIYWANQLDLDRLNDADYTMSIKDEIVKLLGVGVPFKYLGIEWNYDEATKHWSFIGHTTKMIGSSYVSLSNIPFQSLSHFDLNFRRSVLMAYINRYGFGLHQLSIVELTNYSKMISYGIRKIFGIYSTTTNRNKFYLIGLDSVYTMNHILMLLNFKKLMNNVIGKNVWKAFKIKYIGKTIKVKRKIIDNIYDFNLVEEHKFYYDEIMDVLAMNNITNNDLDTNVFKNKIKINHYNILLTKVKNEKTNVLNYLYGNKIKNDLENNLKKTTRHRTNGNNLKLIQQISNYFGMNKDEELSLLRLITDNNQLLWNNEKSGTCVLCQVPTLQPIQHLMNECKSKKLENIQILGDSKKNLFTNNYKKNMMQRIGKLLKIIRIPGIEI